jgi:uncharacterized protein
MQKKSCDIALKDVNTEKGIVEGYFSAFGNVDSDGDMIKNGAFTKSISERGPSGKDRIKHLKNHNPDNLVGKILELKEDETGLYFRSQMSKSTAGKDMLTLYQEGIITEHSIGFQTISWKKEQDKEGKAYTMLTELRLWEGSGVTWGANENTPTTGLKSVGELSLEIEQLKQALLIGGLSDNMLLKLEKHYKEALGALETAIKAAKPHLSEQEKEAKNFIATFKDIFKDE